MRKTAPESLF